MQYNDKLQITTSNAINSVISSYQHNVTAGLRCLMNTAVMLHKTHAPMSPVTANRINIKTTAISSIVIREMNSISVEILSHDAMLERYTL